MTLERGTCRYCGCTDGRPCVAEGRTCSWVDTEHTICSNGECIAKAIEEGDLAQERGETDPVVLPNGAVVERQGLPRALIDSARISVMTALTMIPDDAPVDLGSSPFYDPTVREVLGDAMQLLDAARLLEQQRTARPVTSLHVIGVEP